MCWSEPLGVLHNGAYAGFCVRIVSCPYSKIDQAGEGEVYRIKRRPKGDALCVVVALERWLKYIQRVDPLATDPRHVAVQARDRAASGHLALSCLERDWGPHKPASGRRGRWAIS